MNFSETELRRTFLKTMWKLNLAPEKPTLLYDEQVEIILKEIVNRYAGMFDE